MWRFIIATFAFLGWSFYVLSGGADYEPRTASIQARAKLDDVRPPARPMAVAEISEPDLSDAGTAGEDMVVAESAEDAAVARALASIDEMAPAEDERVQVTLASVSSDETAEPQFESDTLKIDTLTQTPEVAADLIQEPAAPPLDIRKVSGSAVNMRDGPSTFYLVIGRLNQGDEVEVMENTGEGWLKIRVSATGQEGWMADWLVTAAAN